MILWFELPRNWREMSFSDSTNGPSTRTSTYERNSSVTSVRQWDGGMVKGWKGGMVEWWNGGGVGGRRLGPAARQLFEHATGIDPEGLGRAVPFAKAAEERHERALVRRLHRLAAEKRKAGDVGGRKRDEELILDRAGEGLAVVEGLRLLVEAALAAVGTPRNEQRHANAFAVRDVTGSDRCVVHLAALAVLAILGKPELLERRGCQLT